MPFIVLGDFNRRLTQPGDRVWADLDNGHPANADPTVLTHDMPISCRDKMSLMSESHEADRVL